MALPHRNWSDLVSRVLVGHCDDNSFDSIGDFTDDHLDGGYLGWFYEDITPPNRSYWKWFVIVKSLTADCPESMNQAIDYGLQMVLTIDNNPQNCGQFVWLSYTMKNPEPAPATWDKDLVTGKHSDGVIPWADYPPADNQRGLYTPTLQIVNAPYSLSLFQVAADAGEPWGQYYGDDATRNGIQFEITNIVNCDHAFGSQAGDFIDGNVNFHLFTMNFHNPVVNSLNRRWIKFGTTPDLILTGLGFNIDDAEINDPTRNPLNPVGSNWNSLVDYIYIEGEQGQGTFELSRPLGEFTVDSDNQITITNLPILPVGTYQIRLKKVAVGIMLHNFNVESYAGDFKADADGLCVPGPRMRIVVSNSTEQPPGPDGMILLSCWDFKKGEVITNRCYAPIDTRANERFYDGRILSHSALTKSVDDDTGLPNISDITVDLANADKEFSKLLAEFTIKNQIVGLFSAWKHEPESWKQYFMEMIVDDWELQGPILRVTLKDMSQKYFRVSIPRHIITLDEYPDAHESAVGKPMPEVLGKAYFVGDTLRGAVEAHLVDTVNYKYLGARESLHSVTQVYSENALQTLGVNYTISYEDGGRTYINFLADQGDNKITFNCCGYMLGAWNSASGYIQNPAYVIEYLINQIAEVPAPYIDQTSFDALADLMVFLGWDESAYLILQDFQDMAQALSELLFTYGAKIFPDIYGRFKIERKDKHSFETNLRLFDQIDTMEPVTYTPNLRDLVNRIKAVWGHYPCQSLFVGSAEDERANSIETFDVETESNPSPLEFKWTDLESIVTGRIGEELLKKSFGNKKAILSVSSKKVRDIDILDNFQLQDLFAININGEGAQGHYYYFERMGIDFVNGKIDILAPDLGWLIRQCMIIGKCSELEEQWPDASEWMRLYGYIALCLTDKFSDGENAKTICIC